MSDSEDKKIELLNCSLLSETQPADSFQRQNVDRRTISNLPMNCLETIPPTNSVLTKNKVLDNALIGNIKKKDWPLETTVINAEASTDQIFKQKQNQNQNQNQKISCLETLPSSMTPALMIAASQNIGENKAENISSSTTRQQFSSALLYGGSGSTAESVYENIDENSNANVNTDANTVMEADKKNTQMNANTNSNSTKESMLSSSSFFSSPSTTLQNKSDYLHYAFNMKMNNSIHEAYQNVLAVVQNQRFIILRTIPNQKIDLCKTQTGLVTLFTLEFEEKVVPETKKSYVVVNSIFVRGDEIQYLYYVQSIHKCVPTISETNGIQPPSSHDLVDYWNEYKDYCDDEDEEDGTIDDEDDDNGFCNYCGGFNCIPTYDDAQILINDVIMIRDPELRISSMQELTESCNCPKVLRAYLQSFSNVVDDIIRTVILQCESMELKRYGLRFVLLVFQTADETLPYKISDELFDDMVNELKCIISIMQNESKKLKGNIDPEIIVTKNISEDLLNHLNNNGIFNSIISNDRYP